MEYRIAERQERDNESERWTVEYRDNSQEEWASLPVRFRIRGQAQEHAYRMTHKDIGDRAYYFGTYSRSGHYLHDPTMRTLYSKMETGERFNWGDPDIPWKRLDGGMNPPYQREGHCLFHRKDGWTAIAFANRTHDKRGNSNSVFIFEGNWTWRQIKELAAERFPHVMEQIQFPLLLIDPRCQNCQHQLLDHKYNRCYIQGCDCREVVQAEPKICPICKVEKLRTGECFTCPKCGS